MPALDHEDDDARGTPREVPGLDALDDYPPAQV